MTARECGNCGTPIEAAPTILFCSESCCQAYLAENGRLPMVGEL